jgi:hypothetical protein
LAAIAFSALVTVVLLLCGVTRTAQFPISIMLFTALAMLQTIITLVYSNNLTAMKFGSRTTDLSSKRSRLKIWEKADGPASEWAAQNTD